MDYKEKYEQALEKARQLCAYPTTQPFVRDLQDIFPELKESEDEKMRKELISLVRETKVTVRYYDLNKMLAWLEKQGEQKPAEEYNITGIGSKNAQGKLGEMIENLKPVNEVLKQKPVDKVESKFKVGDWFIKNDGSHINKDYDTCKISKVGNGYYTIESIYGYTGKISFETFDTNYHLWTIQDAKDGDVLSNGKMIVIFKHFEEPSYRQHIVAYIGLDSIDNIQITDDTWTLGIDKTKPATKEQRDLLFQKMKEAGYEWDAEKKELRKIEQKPAWSEEDEKFFKTALWHISYSISNGKSTDIHCDTTDWFKNLKDRLQPQRTWKPSDEQMAAFEAMLTVSPQSSAITSVLMELHKQLKRLKEE